MIGRVERPLGWSAREMEMAALVARYHRGALPRPQGKSLQVLELPDRPIAMELAGVLRLANALDARHGDGGEDSPRLEGSVQDRVVGVRGGGYSALDGSAQGVAAARHLLETGLRPPVLVRSLRAATSKKHLAIASS